MLLSKPDHGEAISDEFSKATRQFSSFLEDVAELYSLDSLPSEDERVFKNGAAGLQLSSFLQDAANAAGLVNQPDEGEIIILEDGSATFPFQAFLDNLAG